MGVLYMPFLDVSTLTLGTLTLSDGVHTNIVINLTSSMAATAADGSSSSILGHGGGAISGYYSVGPMQNGSLVSIRTNYALLSPASILQLNIRTVASVFSWTNPTNFTVTFNKTTGRYTIAHTSTSFSVTWSAAAGRLFFGFGGNTSSATSHTGDKTPDYCVNCTYPDVSEESCWYEPDGIGNHVIADDGTGYGISRGVAPLYKDWLQQFETKLKTFRIHGVQPVNSADPFTLQHLFEHCRGRWPFVLDGVGRNGDYYGVSEIYSLRSEGISFQPIRATPGSSDHFHTPFKCHFEGVIDGVLV